MSRVYRDSPVDNATDFNFEKYAESLLKIIINKYNKTPFTIAINGKWGSGKTTLMKTLRYKIQNFDNKSDVNSRKVKTVWFDAWKYADCDSMLAAMIGEILEQMGREGLINNVKSNILMNTEPTHIIKQVGDVIRVLTAGKGPNIENWLKNAEYKNKLSFYDLFQEYMKIILQTFVTKKKNNTYSDEDGILVIFIDDLDRCPPTNVANVLETINLFLDQEGCFFIIGTDISMVSKAIDSKYGNIPNFSGNEYLKKMIQLNFDLPLLQRNDLKNFMSNTLNIDSELDKYSELIVTGLKGNQREIIRSINSLSFMITLGKQFENKEGYQEEVLIKWSILSYSSPLFIEEVKRRQDLLFNIQDFARSTKQQKDEYIKKNDSINKYQIYYEDERIINILSDGQVFTKDNIQMCLFLSNFAPTTIKTDFKRLFKQDSNPFIYKTDMIMDILTKINSSELDLSGVDLNRINLKRMDLSGSNLSEANLLEANLSETNLEGAHLERTHLEVANLERTHLE